MPATRTILEVLALCLSVVVIGLAILAVVGEPGGFGHTEPPPQPTWVEPNPGEPITVTAPEPVPPGPLHSTAPPGGAIHPAFVNPNPTEPVPAPTPEPQPAPEPAPVEPAPEPPPHLQAE